MKIKEGYCPRCQCATCLAVGIKVLEKEHADNEAREELVRMRAEDLAMREAARAEQNREAMMIWLLVNSCETNEQAHAMVYRIAEAMDLRSQQINIKREHFVAELENRLRPDDSVSSQRLLAARAIGGVHVGYYWAKMPGTRGTALPRTCDKCGAMLGSKGQHSMNEPCR